MLDHSFDPNFLASYECESVSEDRTGRLTRIRDARSASGASRTDEPGRSTLATSDWIRLAGISSGRAAVNWFSVFQPRDYAPPGLERLDRFDMLARQPLSASKRLVTGLVRSTGAMQFAAQIFANGTTVWALKGPAPSALRVNAPAQDSS